MFDQTKLLELIKQQKEGQLLIGLAIRGFWVERHMTRDMKSIKCKYNLKYGTNNKYCYIYCMQERTKLVVIVEMEAQKAMSWRPFTWEGRFFSTEIESKLVSGSALTKWWQPILPIPLERVHICTLQALNQITKMMVHIHFMFI